MSGGVDSGLLQQSEEEGFEVEKLFMKNWEDDSGFCASGKIIKMLYKYK